MAKGQENRISQTRQQPPTHEEDPLLSFNEVGRRLGRHPTTVAGWVKDGLLEATREPGGLRRVRTSEVNKILAGASGTLAGRKV